MDNFKIIYRNDGRSKDETTAIRGNDRGNHRCTEKTT